MLTNLLYFVLIGLGIGSIYSLAALGLSVVFRGSNLLNFAQGEFLMLGGFFALWLTTSWGTSYWVALAASVPAGAILGGVLGALFAVPLRRGKVDTDLLIVGTIGIAIALANGASLVIDRQAHRIDSPFGLEGFAVGSLTIRYQYVLILAASMLLFALVRLLYERTDIGLRLRAVAYDLESAKNFGISLRNTQVVAWSVAGALGAAGGALIGAVALVHSSMGIPLTISGFAAAMIGGLSRPSGALVGGLVLGVAEALAAGLLTGAFRETVAPLLILIVVLTRPHGLLGAGAQQRKV